MYEVGDILKIKVSHGASSSGHPHFWGRPGQLVRVMRVASGHHHYYGYKLLSPEDGQYTKVYEDLGIYNGQPRYEKVM